MWLKSWLQESSSIGPKCADGTFVKSMPFTRTDCEGVPMDNEDIKSCNLLENEALLPNLATSQVFSSNNKIKDLNPKFSTNKIINRPTPEESEYFYDEYVDYPYNETLLNGLNNAYIQNSVNKSHYTTIKNPVLQMQSKNNSLKNHTTIPSSGFTFFGMPLPALDVGKLWNSGRKIDLPNKQSDRKINTFQIPEHPKFETGGFSPILPTTAGGFMPIPNPTANITSKFIVDKLKTPTNVTKEANIEQNVLLSTIKPPVKSIHTNATHKKSSTEILELEAYIGANNNTQTTYNRTKNVQEQNTNPNQISKYNFMESNVTITQVTDKENILITTDTSDMTMQYWLDTSTVSYKSSIPPNLPTTKPPIKKHADSPTIISTILAPSNEDLNRKPLNKRPATITKVNLPHSEHYQLQDSYTPVNNREGKTRFSDITNAASTKTRDTNERDWYYKNYNKTNLEPYIAPGIQISSGYFFQKINIILYVCSIIICRLYI